MSALREWPASRVTAAIAGWLLGAPFAALLLLAMFSLASDDSVRLVGLGFDLLRVDWLPIGIVELVPPLLLFLLWQRARKGR